MHDAPVDAPPQNKATPFVPDQSHPSKHSPPAAPPHNFALTREYRHPGSPHLPRIFVEAIVDRMQCEPVRSKEAAIGDARR